MNNKPLTIFGQEPSEVNTLFINNEDDAWNLLHNLQKDDFKLPEEIAFGDWINFEICLQGDKWKSSITPSIFPVFEKLQKTLYRAYAEAKYGNKKHRLTKKEREDIEIIIRISEGSTILENIVDWSKVGKECLEKMDGKHIAIIIIVLILVIGGTVVYRSHLQNTKDIRVKELENEDKKDTKRVMLETFQFAGEQEAKKMEILYSALKGNELAQSIYDNSEDINNEMLKIATKADTSTIKGIYLEEDIAIELVKSKRIKPVPTQINGFFEVRKLEWLDAVLAEITLKRINDDMIVKASFNLDWFNDEDKEIIKNAEWNEEKPKIIKVNINARISSDGKISNAEIARVNAVNEEDYENIKTSNRTE